MDPKLFHHTHPGICSWFYALTKKDAHNTLLREKKIRLQDSMYDITPFVFIDSDYINKKIRTIFKLLIVVISEKWNYWKVEGISFVCF